MKKEYADKIIFQEHAWACISLRGMPIRFSQAFDKKQITHLMIRWKYTTRISNISNDDLVASNNNYARRASCSLRRYVRDCLVEKMTDNSTTILSRRHMDYKKYFRAPPGKKIFHVSSHERKGLWRSDYFKTK
jgi:hypothetical protein